MDEALEKEKYKNIKYRLNIISNKLENLMDDIDNVKKTSKNTLLIDDKVYNEEEINEIKNKIDSIISTIDNDIIYSINQKINQ